MRSDEMGGETNTKRTKAKIDRWIPRIPLFSSFLSFFRKSKVVWRLDNTEIQYLNAAFFFLLK
jgi:hypothetical protein